MFLQSVPASQVNIESGPRRLCTQRAANRARSRRPSCNSQGYPGRATADAALFQKYSECFSASSGLPGSGLGMVALRIANKSHVKEGDIG